jgi:hypothetical protein
MSYGVCGPKKPKKKAKKKKSNYVKLKRITKLSSGRFVSS